MMYTLRHLLIPSHDTTLKYIEHDIVCYYISVFDHEVMINVPVDIKIVKKGSIVAISQDLCLEFKRIWI